MIKRELTEALLRAVKQLPVVAVLGPRQSGKTTIVKAVFANYKYVALEDPDQRKFATEDPRGFLQTYKNDHGIILDEFQNVPEILSYIQSYVDQEHKPGYFILTGSQNFLLLERISQTLAGRIALLTLLPLSIPELKNSTILPEDIYGLIFKGEYPRIYAYDIDVVSWYRDYITTYVERDVRQVLKIVDLNLFSDFIQLCAGRIGQILNLSSLANDCGINVRTAESWLSLLQASYIIYLLQPHYANFSKRIIKSPKLYFYDTGVACSLLKIYSQEQLISHYLRGGLFESLIITEVMKLFFNNNERPNVYFWRDNHGNEIDLILEKNGQLIPIEIKAGRTISTDFFKGLHFWANITENKYPVGCVIFSGDENQKRTIGEVLSWKNISQILKK